jgi:hypothetical protein
MIYAESRVAFRVLWKTANGTKAILLVVHAVVVSKAYSVVALHLSAVVTLFTTVLMPTSITTFMEFTEWLLYAAGAAYFH